MTGLNRREFLSTGLLSTLAIPAGLLLGCAADEFPWATAAPAADGSRPRVAFMGDGLGLTPLEYARLLARLCEEQKQERDVYCEGGPVAELEKYMAGVLGKEHAVL